MIEKRETKKLELKQVDPKEKWLVAKAMTRYGGGFVNALGLALLRADTRNTARIKHGFPDYWKQYLAIAKQMDIDKEWED